MPKRVAEAFPDFNFYCIEQTDAYGVAANSEATMKNGEFVCVSGDSDGNFGKRAIGHIIDGNIVFTEENIDMDEGMQILFEKGYEVEETKGLGFLDGEVVFMDIDEKVPHMGWNQLHFNQNHPILKNIHENDDVYFVHSFMATCPNEQLIAYSDYGKTNITAIAAKDNVIGCQFHPEKSGAVGQKILLAFKEMIEC